MTKTKAPDESVTASIAPDVHATHQDSPDGRFAVAERLDYLAYDIEGIASTVRIIGETLGDAIGVDINSQNGLFLMARNADRINAELCEISLRIRRGKAPLDD